MREAGAFDAFWHPVVAVPCPDCWARIGVMCVRPSGHRAADFHKARKTAADDAFIARFGEDAWIDRTDAGWVVHDSGRASHKVRAAGGGDMPLFAYAGEETASITTTGVR